MFRKGTILLWKEIEVNYSESRYVPVAYDFLCSSYNVVQGSDEVLEVATTAVISDPSLCAETTPCSKHGEAGSDQQTKFTKKRGARKQIVPLYEDLIGDGFWEKNSDLQQGS
jgi:hypothetical protein